MITLGEIRIEINRGTEKFYLPFQAQYRALIRQVNPIYYPPSPLQCTLENLPQLMPLHTSVPFNFSQWACISLGFL